MSIQGQLLTGQSGWKKNTVLSELKNQFIQKQTKWVYSDRKMQLFGGS